MDIYEQLFNNIEEEFKNVSLPFSISCIENIEELNKVFSHEDVILIKDDRSLSYVFDNLTDAERNELVNYTRVFKGNKNFISLKDVILAMSDDLHYINEYIIQDNHCFLEGFDKNSEIQYTAFFGS